MINTLLGLLTFFALHEEPINGSHEMCLPGYGAWHMGGFWLFWSLFIFTALILIVLIVVLAAKK